MTVTLGLAVLVAGAFGALARQLLNDAIAHRVRSDFPFGILTINLLGSFALGLLTGMARASGAYCSQTSSRLRVP